MDVQTLSTVVVVHVRDVVISEVVKIQGAIVFSVTWSLGEPWSHSSCNSLAFFRQGVVLFFPNFILRYHYYVERLIQIYSVFPKGKDGIFLFFTTRY